MTARRAGGAPALGRSFAAVVVVVTCGSLPGFLTGAVSVQLRADLGFGPASLGLAVGVFFLAAACTSAALGRLAERLGPRPSMQLGGGASALALFTVAGVARSFPTLLVGLVVGGVANAMTQPAANLFIARTVPADRLGLAFALKQSGVPASTLLGGLAVPAIALTVGWRWAFVAGGVLALAGAAAVPPVAGPGQGTRRAERSRLDGSLWVLAGAIALGAAAAGTLGAFVVAAGVRAGIGEGRAGLLVAGGSAIVIAVRIWMGRLADRRGAGHLRAVAIMLALGAAGYAAYATGEAVVVLAATPIAFGAGWGWPGLFNLAVVKQHPEAPARASGFTQSGTYLGAFAGPAGFGALVERTSYATAWLTTAAVALAAAALMVAGRGLVRRERLRREAVPL